MATQKSTPETPEVEQAPKLNRRQRRHPIEVQFVDIHVEAYDDELTVPEFASFTAPEIDAFMRSNTALFEALQRNGADEGTVEDLRALSMGELTGFLRDWQQAGSLAAPKSRG